MTDKSKLPRKISNKELADLSHNWINPQVQLSKFIQSAMEAWEVDQQTYGQHIEEGGLGQIQDGRFYIA